MKQIYYTVITMVRGKGSNIIKILSLTFGLMIGLVLFARVTFELNMDNHYHDVDHLMRIKVWFTIGGETQPDPIEAVVYPLTEAIKENFPEEVESVTKISHWPGDVYYKGNHRHVVDHSIYADEGYFRTMGIDVLRGDPAELANVDVMFISESLARQFFDKDDPIGQVLNMNKNYPITVRGVFRDVPETSTLRSDMVISMPTMLKVEGNVTGWGKNDSYWGYVRLKGTDPSAINERMDAMVLKYMPDKGKDGLKFGYFLEPIKGEYIRQKEIQMMVLIMSLLATVVLVIAAMNYILVSVSSLARRSKAIGIHKCSGASNGKIMGMFLIETGIIILISLLLVVLIIINFREPIEDMTFAKLSTLFAVETLWVPALIVLILFLLVGVLPGRMFAHIPVSHIFRRYTEKKTGWKRPLLFAQFSGVAFIAGLLMVILTQYNHITNSDLGYQPANVAYAYIEGISDHAFLKDELRRMPMVDEVAMCAHDLMNGWGGIPIEDGNGRNLFTSRWNAFDPDFIPLMRIEMAEGRNIDGPNQILINEKFVETRKMQESPVGKPFEGTDREGIVVGVMKDFPISSLYNGIKPVMVESSLTYSGGYSYRCVHVRVRELNNETLTILNNKMEEMYPDHDIRFQSLNQRILNHYEGVRRFRDAVVLATISIILITIIGLIGFVSDEIRRRTKEIAVRKVNGATAGDILSLLSGNIAKLAVPAVLLGVIGSWFIGNYWLDQFSEKVALNPLMFIFIGLGVLLLILCCVLIRSWYVANENPVKSIISE